MCLKQVESLLIGGQSGAISKLVVKSKILGQGKGPLSELSTPKTHKLQKIKHILQQYSLTSYKNIMFYST